MRAGGLHERAVFAPEAQVARAAALRVREERALAIFGDGETAGAHRGTVGRARHVGELPQPIAVVPGAVRAGAVRQPLEARSHLFGKYKASRLVRPSVSKSVSQ